MNAPVRGQLRMKGGSHNASLADENREAVAPRQNFHLRPGLQNPRGADKDHLQRLSAQLRGPNKNGGINLPPISIALHNRIQQPKAHLRRMPHLARQQNDSRAGSKDRPLRCKVFERIQKTAALQKLQHRCRFTARKNKTIDTVDFFRLANLKSLRAGFLQRQGVSGKIALNGKNTNARLIRSLSQFVLFPRSTEQKKTETQSASGIPVSEP